MTSLLEVGRILRAHGVRGDVVVRSTTDRDERWAPGSVLVTSDERIVGGALCVVRSRVQPGSLDRIVTFAEVPDRNAAEAVRGVVLSAEAVPAGDEADGDELWVHRLMGATVVDLADGAVKGVVREVHEQAASDVLILDTGHVVPVSFVVRQRGDVIEVEVPMGLWELID